MNYLEEMKEEVKNYIEENHTVEDWDDLEDLRTFLEEQLPDSNVTGNLTGSFYCNRYKAKEQLMNDDFETLANCVEAGYIDYDAVGHRVCTGDWETLDVICREYILCEALEAVIDELKEKRAIETA